MIFDAGQAFGSDQCHTSFPHHQVPGVVSYWHDWFASSCLLELVLFYIFFLSSINIWKFQKILYCWFYLPQFCFSKEYSLPVKPCFFRKFVFYWFNLSISYDDWLQTMSSIVLILRFDFPSLVYYLYPWLVWFTLTCNSSKFALIQGIHFMWAINSVTKKFLLYLNQAFVNPNFSVLDLLEWWGQYISLNALLCWWSSGNLWHAIFQLMQGPWFNKQGMKQLSFASDMDMKCL